MVSSSQDVTTPTMVLLKYGPGLECPWTVRKLAKQRFQSKLLLIPGELSRLLVLMKLHLKNTGYSLLFFYETLPTVHHSELLSVMETWAGPGGEVRMLTEEETGRQMVVDLSCKQTKTGDG